jgi:hypothetical protein
MNSANSSSPDSRGYSGELPTEAVLAITPGRYQHYKNLPYRVHGTARHSETMELLVVYEALYDKPGASPVETKLGKLWVRPAKMFAEFVTIEGQSVPRFKRIGD